MNAAPPVPPNPRPDVTPAQGSSVVLWSAAQAVAYGWLSSPREQLGLSIGATVLAAAWHIADAIIRNGRSRHLPPPTPSS